MSGKTIVVRQFLVKRKGIGLCVVNEDNYTMTYPNGRCETIQQSDVSYWKSLHKHQNYRGCFL